MSARRADECFRCGRRIYRADRIGTDYCTDRCAAQQEHEDRASAAAERDEQEARERAERAELDARWRRYGGDRLEALL